MGTAHAAGAKLNATERALVSAMNDARRAHGLRGLRVNRRLSRAADAHCADMLRANFFAHTSSNGTSMPARVMRYRRSKRVGETIAYLPRSNRRRARRVVNMWMRSPGHRAAILSTSFRRVGVARRTGRLGSSRAAVFTANFASRR